MDKKINKQICEVLVDVCLSLAKYTKDKKHKKQFRNKAKIFKKFSKREAWSTAPPTNQPNKEVMEMEDVDNLLKRTEDYVEGMSEGKANAIKQYDEILLHICNELGEIKKLLKKLKE